jgi:predicted site-specific integrase-resolvase
MDISRWPVAIVTGREDRVSEAQQSAELHRDIARSTFRCISNKEVHQTATAEVMSAIDMVASQKKEAPPPRSPAKNRRYRVA